jgi:hypothetical protein
MERALSAEATSDAAPPPRAHWIIWIFAIVGLVAVLAVLALFVMAVVGNRSSEPPQVAGEKKEAVFTVSTPSELHGTNLLIMNVNLSEGDISSGPYSGGRGDQRNIVLIDKNTGASRKLLPDNSRTIDGAHFLPASASSPTDDSGGYEALPSTTDEKRDAPPPAYYLIVLRQAEQPNAKDVLVGTLSGDRQGAVMRGIDGVETVWMQSPTQIGLIVRDHLKLYYRTVDIPALKVVQSRPIAID